MNTAAPRIDSAVRDHFAPVLRGDGFSGSGRTFRRVVDGWIHVVNVQISRYGGEFAVNLGLQPVSVPDVLGNIPDPKKISEELCEFRRRMPENIAHLDMWWKYETTHESMTVAVREATRTYEKIGRSLLDGATAKTADLNSVSPSAFAAGVFNFLGFGSTKCRMAFTLARLRRAQGRTEDARAFALHALEQVGTASLLKMQIQALLAEC